MVAYIFRFTYLGYLASRTQNYSAKKAPSSASCRASRDLLLHYYRMVELALRKTPVLVHFGGDNRKDYRL